MSAPPTLSVSTSSLPNGQLGSHYAATLVASGGTPPYEWAIASGSLPAGLSLAPATGVIGGVPTAAANGTAITVQVTDSGNPKQSKSRGLSVTISPPPLVITTTSLPQGQVGAAYRASIAATGGTLPYRWSITSGTLSTGLSLASATGVISGTPTAATGAPITFEVSDSSTPVLSKSTQLTMTISAPALAITTTSLPNGQVGNPYSAVLAATGGASPLSWSIASGTLPTGLSLNPSSGAISGTPSATVSGAALTFKVADASNPPQTKTVALTLNVSPPNISVAISPQVASLAVTQVASLLVTTNDAAGVRWSISPSGGSFNPVQSLSGADVAFTAPATAGAYTVTATSVTDVSQSSSIQVGVTNLPGVFSYHNDLARDGVNGEEYSLTSANVSASGFGKLFSCAVDGAVYAQPLWVANLTIGGARHNVVFVATEHDSLFAFDADANPCLQLWSVSLIDSNHGATPGETTVPSGTTGNLVGSGYGDITPEVGVTSTPVIDPTSAILYVVSKSTSGNSGTTAFYQRLHAIDMTTGMEKALSPTLIQATYPGTGDGTATDAFNARAENQRAGLALVNGTVYIAWASHEDAAPYYGWVMGYLYGASGFTQTAVLNVTPNVHYGGIWMSGAAPSADPNGNLYLITGNGGFDATSTSAPNDDYGDSLLELSAAGGAANPDLGLAIAQYFTPSDQLTDAEDDKDFGAGGTAVLADVIAGSPPQTTQLVVGGGKDGNLYILDRNLLGGYGDSNAWQEINTGHGIFCTAAFWNNTIYLATVHGALTSYSLDASSTPIQFALQSTATSPSGGFGFPGATPSVSSSGSTNGLVWALDTSQYCTNQSQGCGPAVLHAYDATALTELWNSSLAGGGADAAGYAVKFAVPTIANGKVYVGTRGNNIGGATASTSAPGELDVYGLKPE
jgi:hypothetical protein